MINAAALAPEASLIRMQPATGVQPCRQAGVDDHGVHLSYHIQQGDATSTRHQSCNKHDIAQNTAGSLQGCLSQA